MPVQFTCPHCQTTMHVEAAYRGQSGPCAICGATVAVPADAAAAPERRRQSGGSWWGRGVLILLAVGVGVALIACLPYFIGSGEEPRRNGWEETVKTQPELSVFGRYNRIYWALQSYVATKGAYPKAATTDDDGKRLLSWRVELLPFLGYQDLYGRFNHDEPWDSPHNLRLVDSMPREYVSPDEHWPGMTRIQAIVGPNSVIHHGDADVAEEDITDGLDETAILITAPHAVVWTKPDDFEYRDNLDPHELAMQTPFDMLFADGRLRHSRFLQIQTNDLQAISTRSEGDELTAAAQRLIEQ